MLFCDNNFRVTGWLKSTGTQVKSMNVTATIGQFWTTAVAWGRTQFLLVTDFGSERVEVFATELLATSYAVDKQLD